MGDGGTSVGQASRLQTVWRRRPLAIGPPGNRRFADDRTF
jgi:hypothetical protein